MGKESINFDKNPRKIGKLFMTVIMFAIGIIMILPFVWMLSTSFKLEVDVFKFPIEWIPRRFTTKNYVEVWLNQNPPFYVYYLNSIKITVICVLGELATSSLAAYGFSRLNFKGRDSIFLMYLGTMMIPLSSYGASIHVVPMARLYNTHWSLILLECLLLGSILFETVF